MANVSPPGKDDSLLLLRTHQSRYCKIKNLTFNLTKICQPYSVQQKFLITILTGKYIKLPTGVYFHRTKHSMTRVKSELMILLEEKNKAGPGSKKNLSII